MICMRVILRLGAEASLADVAKMTAMAETGIKRE
jgi:hypothetical protein